MLTWLGRTLHRLRWSVLLLTLVLTTVMAWYGFGVFDALGGISLNTPGSESVRAQNLLNSTFTSQSSDSSVVLLLSDASLKATDPTFVQAATKLINTLKARHEVVSLESYYTTHDSSFLSRDGRETFVVLNLSNSDSAYTAISPLFTAPPLHIDVGGELVVNKQFDAQLQHDLEFAETIALPVVALLLILIFGGVVAAILPLLIGGFAIVGSFAILRLLTNVISVSSLATNVITIIGLGLAIDYSLFIVTRFREELFVREGDVGLALQRTMATAGRTILFSGLTVCTSLVSLLLFPGGMLRSVGLATIAAALVAMLGAITVLPAILAVLGSRVNALSIQRLFGRRSTPGEMRSRGAWYSLSYFVMRWRIPIAICGVAFLLLVGTPFLHVTFIPSDERTLPLNASSRIVAEDLKQNFPGQNDTTLTVVVQTRGKAVDNANLARLDSYVRKIKTLQGVTQVSSLVSLDPSFTLAQYQQAYNQPVSPQAAQADPRLAAWQQEVTSAEGQLAKGNVTRVDVTASFDPTSSAATDLVKQIRAIHTSGGMIALVGGQSAENLDQSISVQSTLPYAILVMAAAIFLLLFLMTGSLVIPLKAIVLNILSLTATFGAIVWIFQDGHFQDFLGFRAFGGVDSTQLILIFAIAFGLSMDYEVFLLSRIKEHFDKTENNREAVAIGLQRTGWLITSAAMLLAIVVSAFASSRIMSVQEIGLGLALAVLMDATLVRALLVPSMMALMGKWNWWAPRPLRVLWNRIGLRELPEDAYDSDPDVRAEEVSLT